MEHVKEILIALDNYKNGENRIELRKMLAIIKLEQYYQLVRFNSTKKWYGGNPDE
jgi:hypothetical protein